MAIAGTDEFSEGVWTDEVGIPLTYEPPFQVGDPNNANGDEHCLAVLFIHPTGVVDYNCDLTLEFGLCEAFSKCKDNELFFSSLCSLELNQPVLL